MSDRDLEQSQSKVKKEIKPIDPVDVAECLDAIVAFLGAIASSREEINSRVKHLKETYGLNQLLFGPRPWKNSMKKNNK